MNCVCKLISMVYSNEINNIGWEQVFKQTKVLKNKFSWMYCLLSGHRGQSWCARPRAWGHSFKLKKSRRHLSVQDSTQSPSVVGLVSLTGEQSASGSNESTSYYTHLAPLNYVTEKKRGRRLKSINESTLPTTLFYPPIYPLWTPTKPASFLLILYCLLAIPPCNTTLHK